MVAAMEARGAHVFTETALIDVDVPDDDAADATRPTTLHFKAAADDDAQATFAVEARVVLLNLPRNRLFELPSIADAAAARAFAARDGAGAATAAAVKNVAAATAAAAAAAAPRGGRFSERVAATLGCIVFDMPEDMFPVTMSTEPTSALSKARSVVRPAEPSCRSPVLARRSTSVPAERRRPNWVISSLARRRPSFDKRVARQRWRALRSSTRHSLGCHPFPP